MVPAWSGEEVFMRRNGWIVLALCLWLGFTAMAAPAQDSHRRPTTPPPRPGGDVFDQIEREQRRQEREAARRKKQQERAARVEHREALRQLRQDVPQLRDLLAQMEADLRETDVRTELNVNFSQHADQLEKLAKRIRKNVRKL